MHFPTRQQRGGGDTVHRWVLKLEALRHRSSIQEACFSLIPTLAVVRGKGIEAGESEDMGEEDTIEWSKPRSSCDRNKN